MIRLIKVLGRVGEWAAGLSDQTKKNVCVLACLAMFGSACYKLTTSWRKLDDKPAPASSEQLIEPLRSLFSQTGQTLANYRQDQQRDRQRIAHKLDSLNKASTK